MYSIDPSNNNHTSTGKTLSAQQNAATAMNQDSTALPNTNKMHSSKERPYHLKRTQLKEFDSRSAAAAAADPSFHTVSPKKMKPTASMNCYYDDTIVNNNSNAMNNNNTAASNGCEGNAFFDFDLTPFDLYLAPPYDSPMSFGYQNANPFEKKAFELRKQQEIDGNRISRPNASPLTASSLSQLPLRNTRQNMKSIINSNNNCSRNIYSSRMKNEEDNILHKQELNRRKRNCEKIAIWNLVNN
jgi:hypothetical protein